MMQMVVITDIVTKPMCSFFLHSTATKLLCRFSLPEWRHLLQPIIHIQLQLPCRIQWKELRKWYIPTPLLARTQRFILSFSLADVQVLSRPVIMAGPSTVFASLFQSVNFTCNANGNPQPTITWFKDSGTTPVQNGPVLTIPEVRLSDRGNYSCRASNTQGSTMSAPAYLNIKG